MKKVFITMPHNNPSGGTKVANQIVNLFRAKNFESFIVNTDKDAKSATFLKEPAPTISLDEFKKTCESSDIVITFWQSKSIFEAIKQCPAEQKIFWQHGILTPTYKDFDSEIFFRPGVFTAYWNVSAACANFIKDKYKLPEAKIVNPFFDDDVLLTYAAKQNENNRDGILILRRRGQEAIPEIIAAFPNQKVTVLEKSFSDERIYSELIKHKYFISTDNGLNGTPLITSPFKRLLKKYRHTLQLLFKKSRKDEQIKWVKTDKNYLGFPMTACEAAWLGTAVIGFAMGGGLEWMSDENMYLAKDADINSLLAKTLAATTDSESVLSKKIELAKNSVAKFTRENTWKQLADNLKL